MFPLQELKDRGQEELRGPQEQGTISLMSQDTAPLKGVLSAPSGTMCRLGMGQCNLHGTYTRAKVVRF